MNTKTIFVTIISQFPFKVNPDCKNQIFFLHIFKTNIPDPFDAN